MPPREAQIEGPCYLVTPPQANNLTAVLDFLIRFDTEDSELNKIVAWLESEPREEHEITSAWRSYGYHLHALRWLGLVEGEGRFMSGRYTVTPKGRLVIESSPSQRVNILADILLQDSVYRKIGELRRDRLPRYLLLELLTSEIMGARCLWRNHYGRRLARTTARRRGQCAIAWSKQLGILPP